MHERTLQGDFLMALLKDLVPRRRAARDPLKVSRGFTLRTQNAACVVLQLCLLQGTAPAWPQSDPDADSPGWRCHGALRGLV